MKQISNAAARSYLTHRRNLAQRLPDGLILLSGGRLLSRNGDNDYVFRQRSNFLYLCGVEEPDCQLLIDPRRGRQTLLMPRIDNEHRVWLGHVPDPAEARRLFKVQHVAYTDELPVMLRKSRSGYRRIYADQDALKFHRKALRGLRACSGELTEALSELRVLKTPGEIALIEAASAATGRAHRAVMAEARPGQYECEAQAAFEAECLKAGMPHLAFPTIAAAGTNSAVLHYHNNDSRMKSGDLLLLDAGTECHGYAADVTRTFPVNGRFTARQKDVYSIVLQAQKECIDLVRPGLVSAELHRHSMRVIAEGLKSLRILRGETEGLIDNGAVRLFYPHGVSHTMGVDVHDVDGGHKRAVKNPFKFKLRFLARLEPGFVISMEPGIYFIKALLQDPENRRKHKASVDFSRAESYLDFGGIRIEDDILVTPNGRRNLTNVPKEIREVEAACRR